MKHRFRDDGAGREICGRIDRIFVRQPLRPLAAGRRPGDRPPFLAVGEDHIGVVEVKQAGCGRDDAIEYGRSVGRRAGDDPENLGRRRFALQRLLRLVEQARVLDGDHRLIAERFRLGDLLGAETVRARAHDKEDADAGVLAQKRQVKRCLRPKLFIDDALVRRQVDLGQIWKVQHRLVDKDARGEIGVGVDPGSEGGIEYLQDALAVGARGVNKAVSIAQQHPRKIALENPHGGEDDALKHRAGIGRRLADDAQDFGRRRLPLERLLRLVEEARILDGDHRLVAEGFRLGDFLQAETVRFASAHGEKTDAVAVAQERKIERAIDVERVADGAFVLGKLDCRPVRQIQPFAREKRARREVGLRVDRRAARELGQRPCQASRLQDGRMHRRREAARRRNRSAAFAQRLRRSLRTPASRRSASGL